MRIPDPSAPAYDARVDAAIESAKGFQGAIGYVLDQGAFTLHAVLDRWLRWVERDGPASDDELWHALRMLAGHDLDGFYPDTPPVVGEIVSALVTIAATLDIAIAERDSGDNPGNEKWVAGLGYPGEPWTTGDLAVIVAATEDLTRAVASLTSEAGVSQVSK
jgi:hypothetical protein